jgi:NADH:ubiquinone oxidoreductase subunit 2 (subunit N)
LEKLWICNLFIYHSFIPLISSQENIYITEASLKYFLVQALASSSLLFLVVIKTLVNHTMLTRRIHSYAVITPLLMKMGAAMLLQRIIILICKIVTTLPYGSNDANSRTTKDGCC